MKDLFEKLNIPMPECNKCGSCCCCASSSVSYRTLLEKAASGEEFARDFFSIFIPYKNIEETKKLFPTIVERSIKAAEKEQNKLNPEELVFYKCRYYSEENQCLVYEDRPLLCREFPGSPFAILSDKCAFYNRSKECREKYKELKQQLSFLKKCKEELNNIKYRQKAINLNRIIKNTPEEYKFMLLCPSMSLVSPAFSVLQ